MIIATVLTCGAAGAGAASVGAAMLAGGLISAGVNAVDQLHDGGEFDWAELAIATLAGTAYGFVVGLTGGGAATVANTGWSWKAFAGKLAIAGSKSLLDSWNEEKNSIETMFSLGRDLAISGGMQVAGYKLGPVVKKIQALFPRNPQMILTMGDIAELLWEIPAFKMGVTGFMSGIVGAIFNDFGR